MSNPNYVHTITLYRQRGGIWSRTVLHGCFFKEVATVVQSGTQATQASTYTARIPLDVAGSGFTVRPGDIVILGEVTDEVSDEKGYRAAEILLRYKPAAFKATVATDNTSHLMDKHYRYGG